MNKKQTILAAAGGVSALLVVGAGVLTFTSWQAAGDAEKKMQSSKSSLSRYYKEAVFPSQANVDVYRTNLLLAQTWVGDLSRGVFRDGVAVDDSVTRGDFGRVCRETVEALIAEAPQNTAEEPVVDADASFGFDHYLQNNLPERDEYVPRLLRQLRLVDRIVRILYDAEIHHLDAVGRELFDLGRSGASSSSSSAPVFRHGKKGRKGAASSSSSSSSAVKTIAVPSSPFVPDESVPMSRERFGFLFTTRQEGLIAAVNAIDAMRPFAMVSGLEFAKTGEDVLVPAEPDPAAEAAAPKDANGILEKPAPRTARLVSGPLFETPVQVTLYVDVYAPATAADVAAAGEGDEEGEEEY